MTLLFDTRWIGAHGIGRFAREIMARLNATPIDLKGHPLAPLAPLRLSRALRLHQEDFYFSPGFNAPFRTSCPFALTVHDLIHLDIPEESSFAKRFYYENILRPALSRARIVFTVSNFSKSRIVSWSGLSEEKIWVVGNGVSPEFRPEGPRFDSRNRPYLLYVGNHKPHKNCEGLLDAFAETTLRSQYDLLMTGVPSSNTLASIRRHQLASNVELLGLVPESLLPALYRGATAVVVPSWYEGFGFPVIEAMASGTPVISSHLTALPEAGGNAALYFDPKDTRSLIDQLHRVTDLSLMAALRQKGLDQALQFNWDQVAGRVKAGLHWAAPELVFE